MRLRNLVENVAKYATSNTLVEVELSLSPESEEVRFEMCNACDLPMQTRPDEWFDVLSPRCLAWLANRRQRLGLGDLPRHLRRKRLDNPTCYQRHGRLCLRTFQENLNVPQGFVNAADLTPFR